jgi:hypothetical protein
MVSRREVEESMAATLLSVLSLTPWLLFLSSTAQDTSHFQRGGGWKSIKFSEKFFKKRCKKKKRAKFRRGEGKVCKKGSVCPIVLKNKQLK